MFKQINEVAMSIINMEKDPCLWCDTNDTCNDIFCTMCDGESHDFIN